MNSPCILEIHHTMNRFWRTVKRLADRIDRNVERLKSGKGRPFFYVMPATFLGSFFIPKSFIQSLIKQRYGLMNDEDSEEIPAETRKLLEEVLNDLKESKTGLSGKLLDHLYKDLALYRCKGEEIVIHQLMDITSVSLRVLIGIPSHLLNSTTGDTSAQNLPGFTDIPSKTSCSSSSYKQSSPSLSEPTGNDLLGLMGNEKSTVSSSKSRDSPVGALEDSMVLKGNNSQSNTELEESENFKNLDYLSDISRWEKKFAILREILLSRQYYQDETVFYYIILMSFILSLFLTPPYFRLIYLNIFMINGLILKYRRCNGNVIRKKGHEQVLKILTASELKDHSNYVTAGRKYCMRRLKRNCDTYKLQKRKAEDSFQDKLQLLMNVTLHRFVPNCENVYNCAGGVRAWPANYFNHDFFWAYRMQKHVKELNCVTEKEVKNK